MNANEDKGSRLGHPFGELSQRVIGCAIAVSNALGAGFLESVYENALCVELAAQGIAFARQHPLVVTYRGTDVGHFFADVIVDSRLLLELKALKQLAPEHEAQVLNYLRATGLHVALLLNFGSPRLGIRRIVWDYKDSSPA
jgi:GxxExxY protein